VKFTCSPESPLRLQPLDQQVEQPSGRLHVAQQPITAHRRERHRAQQLRIIADAGALAGVGPGPVEYVFAVGMALAIQRQSGDQRALLVAQQPVFGPPTATPADAAALFECGQEGVTQEGLRIGKQRIPVFRGDFGEAGNRLDRHARQSASAVRRKKAKKNPPKGGIKEHASGNLPGADDGGVAVAIRLAGVT